MIEPLQWVIALSTATTRRPRLQTRENYLTVNDSMWAVSDALDWLGNLNDVASENLLIWVTVVNGYYQI